MDTVTWVQILDKADCVSYCTNTLWKGMNPTIFPLAKSKIVGGNQSRRRKNFEFKPVKLQLKIDLVSHPAHTEGLVNTYSKGILIDSIFYKYNT